MINKRYEEHIVYEERGVDRYLVHVFSKMCFGLVLTFVTSFLLGVGFPHVAVKILSSSMAVIAIAALEIGLIIALMRKVSRLETNGINLLYYTFTIVNGILLSYIYFIFSSTEIFTALVTTSIFFGTLAAYGHFTRKDLSQWGSILRAALISILVVSLVELVLSFFSIRSVGLSILVSAATIIVMSLYVAYDIQMIKYLYFSVAGNEEGEKAISTMGAFQLYINFINIFQHVLRIILLTRDKK